MRRLCCEAELAFLWLHCLCVCTRCRAFLIWAAVGEAELAILCLHCLCVRTRSRWPDVSSSAVLRTRVPHQLAAFLLARCRARAYSLIAGFLTKCTHASRKTARSRALHECARFYMPRPYPTLPPSSTRGKEFGGQPVYSGELRSSPPPPSPWPALVCRRARRSRFLRGWAGLGERWP